MNKKTGMDQYAACVINVVHGYNMMQYINMGYIYLKQQLKHPGSGGAHKPKIIINRRILRNIW